MALPKKKGIRKITIDQITYYFKIDTDYYSSKLRANIGLEEKPNRRFSLFTDNHPITPKIIAESILLMNKKINWQKENSNFSLVHENDQFVLN
ncbi:hypothetical protein [Aureivirga sp. CE67]|uniref:hypothetical protein n=1 Tax=Aureivirga sp. CE67 TaxID=1788983 RepID=UPI0018CBAA57|nr:hypothetical protein [Aureivirga sp. CE67]